MLTMPIETKAKPNKNGMNLTLFTPSGGQSRNGYSTNTTIQVKNLDGQKKSMWRIL